MLRWYANPNDRWEGYWQERKEILDFLESEKIINVVSACIYARLNPCCSPAIHEVITGPIGQNTFYNAVGPLGMPIILFIDKYVNNAYLLQEGRKAGEIRRNQ